MYASL